MDICIGGWMWEGVSGGICWVGGGEWTFYMNGRGWAGLGGGIFWEGGGGWTFFMGWEWVEVG